jgi:uncharacterized protein
MKSSALVLLMLLILGICFHEGTVSADQGNVSWQRIKFLPSGLTIVAQKADSEEKRQKGLMGRRHLKDQEGMIFSFDETTIHAFWMFNTPIPLAVIFVDDNLVVVDVQYMNPCLSPKPDTCPVYVARGASRFAIEINQDVSRKYRIAVGNRITFEDAKAR